MLLGENFHISRLVSNLKKYISIDADCNMEFFSQGNDLAIDESSFTGETEPSIKDTQVVLKPNGHTTMKNIAFMGTLVRCGNGKVRAD